VDQVTLCQPTTQLCLELFLSVWGHRPISQSIYPSSSIHYSATAACACPGGQALSSRSCIRPPAPPVRAVSPDLSDLAQRAAQQLLASEHKALERGQNTSRVSTQVSSSSSASFRFIFLKKASFRFVLKIFSVVYSG